VAEQIPVAYALNLLEATTSAVTVTGTAAGSSLNRLFDRDITLPWIDSGTAGTRNIQVDQGAGGTQAVSSWIIAGPHNLAVALSLESSPDNAAWTVRDTVTPATTVAFRRSFSPITARYWRLQIPSPASAPSIPEFFLTVAVPFPKGPHPDGARRGVVPNVVRHESVGGYVWKTRRGGTRWRAEWPLRLLTDAQRQTFETLLTALLDASRPFWLEDVDGVLRWVEWTNAEATYDALANARQNVTLAFEATL
jgi:hypothetical protein